VFYYEQKDPIYNALLVFFRTQTVFGLVIKRLEFWVYLALHVVFMTMFYLGGWDTGDLGALQWEAVNATMMFMVFLLTFFNGVCYERYLLLYDHCMEVLDHTTFFVQEIVVSLSPASVELHRIRAVKYIIAMLHIFFVGATGRMKSKADWKQLVDRGLLTMLEAEQLQHYPSQSVETVLVLATWAMQIVDKALQDDAFWHARSQRIAHTHNRLQWHITGVLDGIHKIGDMLALPIPYPYYHAINVVLLFNMMMLCIITASFRTYQTVFPFVISLFFFLGLREVAAALSDPFNSEGSSLPISSFLEYAFDTSVCLLEAFRCGDADEFTRDLLLHTREFTDDQLRHELTDEVLYKQSFDPQMFSPFSWNREMPLNLMTADSRGPQAVLSESRMNPSYDWHTGHGRVVKEEAEEDEDWAPKPKKRSFLAKLCCKRTKEAPRPEEEEKPPELIRSEAKFEHRTEHKAQLQEEIDKGQEQLDKLKSSLAHYMKVGNELGLRVDEVVSLALHKTERPSALKPHQPIPEFISFAEAHRVVADSAVDKRPGDRSV